MKFKEGKVLDKFILKNGEEAVIQFPRQSDAAGFMKFINSLVREKAQIRMNRIISLEAEKKWLKGHIENCKKGKVVDVCVSIGNEIVGNIEMKKGEGADHKIAEMGLGVVGKYRKFGIATRMFMAAERVVKNIGVDVLVSSCYATNIASIKFHKKFGFTKVGVIPKSSDHYGERVDHVFMYKRLKK
jgi:RimJ/RimL family protein N-acetyltransferase